MPYLFFMLCLLATGCQSITHDQQVAGPNVSNLQALYQDLMPIMSSYYALGHTTFLAVSPEDFAQALTPSYDLAQRSASSPELLALSTVLRQGGAASCSDMTKCDEIEPTIITTSIISPKGAAHLLVEVKTKELTLQRLYASVSLQPLSAISVQAKRAPLYDLSQLKDKPSFELDFPPEPEPSSIKQVVPKPKATSKNQAPTKNAPQGRVIEILTAKQAPTTPNTQVQPKQPTSAQAELKPAAPGALENHKAQRAHSLGLPQTPVKQAEPNQELARLSSGLMDLQLLAAPGDVNSHKIQTGLRATLDVLQPGTTTTLNSISNAVTSAERSIAAANSSDSLNSSLSAFSAISSSAKRITQALNQAKGQAQNQSQDQSAAQSGASIGSVFASSPYQPKTEENN